jgi:trk system potassium uptake protein TrkH
VRVPIRRRVPPRRWSSTPIILLGAFVLINLVGGALLYLPWAAVDGTGASLQVAFFTAVSASTVTGLVLVDTQVYWSLFGQVIIFFLMLLGGLEFITAATVLIAIVGRRATAVEEDVYQDTVGSGYSHNIGRTASNIVVAFVIGYAAGAVLLFLRMRTIAGFSIEEAAWQSLFLSVSALNNAGFSILPNAPSGNNADTLGSYPYLMGVITPLIILGAVGWPLIADIRRNWRTNLTFHGWTGWLPFNFYRLSLDTKLVLIFTTTLYAFSALIFLFGEWNGVLAGNSFLGKVGSSIFHGVSGRTAGFAALDWSATVDFTQLVYGSLMFVGGSTASVAGGIKVNTLAVILIAARSSALRHAQTEIFRREIGPALVSRALLVALLGIVFLGLVIPILTYTDPNIPFVSLMFETISAFGTNGMSGGASAQLSLAGSIIFMITMLVGRIGPLTLVMLLAPRADTSYRYPEEPVRIG